MPPGRRGAPLADADGVRPCSRRRCLGINAGEVAACRPRGHGDGALPPTPALEGVDHGGKAPPWDLVLACWRQAREPCGGFGDRADVFLEDDRRRGGGTAHRPEPAQVGWAPGGPAGSAEIGSEQRL
jgi:hypothetical protein